MAKETKIMKKGIIILLAGIFVGIGASIGAASVASDTCGYDPKTGYYTENGVTYAFGPWDAAIACALQGKLPEIVVARLGKWGTDDDKATAKEAIAEQEKIKAAAEAEKGKQ